MPYLSNSSRIGFHIFAKYLKPSSTILSETGGKLYSMCQMEEPVKPLTTEMPRFFAALAEAFMDSTAHSRFASGLPLHFFGTMPKPSERLSLFGSQTSWPARWLLMAQHFKPLFSRTFSCALQYFLSVAALKTSMWSPQQASSRPS